jgi:hypothetical protein
MPKRRFLLFCALAASAAGSPRDWAVHPAIVQRPAAETIYALGDIHGDYERLVTLLTAAHIVGKDTHWAARKATLVVTGDMIDKGPRPVDVIRLLAALRTEAPAAGGEVVLLSGNHEAEFLAGTDAKKAADFIADLKKSGFSPSQVAACKTDIGDFLCTLPYAARIGDWFFSHGGNTAGRTIPQLAKAIESGAYPLTDPNSILEARLGEGKEQWIEAPNQRALLQMYADALGVKHMVQGHQHNEVRFADGVTRHAGQMFCRWGLLCLIDVGMSREIGDSHGAILRITNARVTAIYPDGSEKPVETSQ